MAQRPSPRQVVIVLFPEVQSLDVTGPLEVFAGAGRLADRLDRTARGYEIRTLSADGKALQTSSGLTLVPHGRLDQAPAKIDTLIVPGGAGAQAACADERLLAWIATTAARSPARQRSRSTPLSGSMNVPRLAAFLKSSSTNRASSRPCIFSMKQ